MSDIGDHTHRWRATSKVFALVCDCGETYHVWLLTEIEKLKAIAATPLEPFITQGEVDKLNYDLAQLRVEIDQLHAALALAKNESATLRADLSEARLAIEGQADEVTSAIVGA